MLELAIGNQRPELLVIWIEQLVIDDFCQHAFLSRQPIELVQFCKRQNRRLFDQHVFARFERGLGCREMAIVGRRDTDEIDAVVQKLTDRVGLFEALKRIDPAGC